MLQLDHNTHLSYVTFLGPVEVAVLRRGHLARAPEAAAGEASVEDVEVVDAEVRKNIILN